MRPESEFDAGGDEEIPSMEHSGAGDDAGYPHRVYLSLGANIGSREQTLGRALKLIAATPGTVLRTASALYATDPVGYLDQPEFLNCAALFATRLSPEAFLDRCRAIERLLGRKERSRWREREIDIDIILFDDLAVDSEKLTIPHPEMHRRGFVLVPLAEIAPDVLHPTFHQTIRELLEMCGECGGVRKFQPPNE